MGKTKLSSSPKRGSFSKDSYHKRLEEDPTDTAAKNMIEMYDQMYSMKKEQEESPEWQKNNLEYDLRTTDWILEKARESRVYAQHLYAALCNNEFQKLEVMPILKEETWSCSWRRAGGIIADMRQDGDYIDWYCSGIRNDDLVTDEETWNWTSEAQLRYRERQAFVAESVVTDEIRADLKRLGWIVILDKGDE